MTNPELSNLPVTVGLPVFNDPEGLRRSVPSVLEQTWDGDLRVLVVDDASTDETPRVLDELRDHYGPHRVQVVRNDGNQGRPYSRNRILDSVATGHLAWVDADDRWHPSKVELQIETLERNAQRQEPLICTGPVAVQWRARGTEVVKHPEVRGDQVRNLMLGKLFAYLGTMLGPVEHFRLAGRFDLRLRRRQDYELMLRFLAAGGALVAPDTATPLVLYDKTDVGRSSVEVARANRVIWAKHRDLYLAQGRRFAWERRASQHRLVARFSRANGQRWRSMGYALAAGWAHRVVAPPPREVLAAAPRDLERRARALQRPAKKVAGALLREVARLTPVARRAGLPGLAEAIGARGAAERLGFGGLLERAVLAAGPDSVGFWALYGGPADASGRPAPAEDAATLASVRLATDDLRHRRHQQADVRIKGLLEEHGAALHPRVYEALAREQIAAGDARGAQATLRGAVTHHPSDERLLLALVEATTLDEEWAEAFTWWSKMPRRPRNGMSRASCVRVGRMLRINGRYAEADAVVSEGLRRYPNHPVLEAEHRRLRAHLVDWRSSLVPASDGSGRTPAGRVERLGFLGGEAGTPASGSVDPQAWDGHEVALRVNGVAVASSSPTPSEAPEASEEARPAFAVSCPGLLEYLGDGDLLTFSAGERPLWIEDLGTACEVRVGYPSRFDELEERLARPGGVDLGGVDLGGVDLDE